jgi:hypothetical protein
MLISVIRVIRGEKKLTLLKLFLLEHFFSF